MKFIDLFAGIGGFRIAAERNNIKCVFSSDIDKYSTQTYLSNFNEHPHGDIKEINTKDIPSFDILTAGFPCQPFSYSGKLKGFKDRIRGTLFFDIHRILKHHKPKMFLLENVKGLVSHNKGDTLKVILKALSSLDYDVHWKVISSLNFGLPQKRERWYCVGFNKKVNYEFPKIKLNDTPKIKDVLEKTPSSINLKLKDHEIHMINNHFNSNEVRVKHDNSRFSKDSKKGKHGVYSFLKPDGSLRFHIGDKSKTQIQEMYYSSVNTYSSTIIANRSPKLWDIKRKLSVRECARLQGFPEYFKFPCSDTQSYKQLGNSVSVPVVQELIKSMLNSY